ncbi:rod shape-determining protein RodA [bacterium]|nr:rod shape-determining protein RodA [bacterium]
MTEINRRIMNNPHYPFLLTIISLLLFGIISIYSASFSMQASQVLMMKHFIFIGLGFILFTLIIFLPRDSFQDITSAFYWVSISLLLVLLVYRILHIGNESVYRWIQIGSTKLFQPSEFIKIALILMLAKVYTNPKKSNWRAFFEGSMYSVLPFFLVMLQPDLGSASIILLIFLSMTFISRLGFGYVLLSNGLMVLAFFPARKYLIHDYQIQRILTFLNPEADPTGEGWSIMQALIAIGSGGIHGKGFLQGTQSKMRFLPDTQYSDFIFSVIGEEFGLLGSLLLIVLFIALLMCTLDIFLHSESNYLKIVVLGVACYWLIQFFTNIAMNISLMPVTGIPLPFISYGGSALLTNFIAAGIVYYAQIHRKKIEF